jgi:hypothetical protein
MITFGAEYTFLGEAVDWLDVCKIDSLNFIVVYRRVSDVYPYCVIGTVTNTNEISYGASYLLNIQFGAYNSISLLDSTHFVVVSRQGVNNGQAVIGIITNINEIGYGDIANFYTGDCLETDVNALDSTHFVVVYRENTGGLNDFSQSKIGTVSGSNTITFGSQYVVVNKQSVWPHVAKLDSTHFAVSYFNAFTYTGLAKIGTVSAGNVISYGSAYQFEDTQAFSSCSALDSSHFVVTFNPSGTYSKARVGTITSVDQITFGAAYQYADYGDLQNVDIVAMDSTHFMVPYVDATNHGYANVGVVSNVDNITYGIAAEFNNASTDYTRIAALDSVHAVIVFRDNGNSSFGKAIIGSYTSESPGNFLAFF